MASLTTQITENLFTFQIPLPNNPLKWLNCYVIKGEKGRSLLIDTGFRLPECQDVLNCYLQNLDRVAVYDVTLALPAHRSTGDISMRPRIEQLKAHHAARLAEIQQKVREYPGRTAYEIAGLVTWRIRAKSWDDFPADKSGSPLARRLPIWITL